MAGIIETGDGKAMFSPEPIERHGLGAGHVGAEAAEPEQAGLAAGAPLDGDAAFADGQEISQIACSTQPRNGPGHLHF